MVRSSSRSGFTLLELLLVMTVIVILAAVSYPSALAMYQDLKLQEGADLLRARFAEARARAIDEGRPYRFGVIADTGEYKLAPDSAAYWDDGSPQTADDAGTAQPLIRTEQLPNNIVFQLASQRGGGAYTRLLTFLPDGTCEEDCSIRLALDGASDLQPLEINVRGLSGSVTVRSVPGDR